MTDHNNTFQMAEEDTTPMPNDKPTLREQVLNGLCVAVWLVVATPIFLFMLGMEKLNDR